MKEIVTFKVDEKIVMDRCLKCDMKCKIMSAAWAACFEICCDADRAGLREKARALGLSLVEISIGGEAAEESASI
jgi:hypothetical protein